MKQFLLPLVFSALCTRACCQLSLSRFNEEKSHISQTGFRVLGAWSAANVISGVIGQSTAGGEGKYFYRMNAIWGAVNLAVAIPGYLAARKHATDNSLETTLRGQSTIEKTFVFNAGLDLAYLAGGAWFLEKGNNQANPDKYRGFGKGILMQGAFLLIFDAVMFSCHNHHGKLLYRALNGLQVSPNGVGMTVRL